MNINYDLELEKIINGLDYKPRLLLHSCCAPCSSAVIERLIPYFDITIIYYNPNIEPYEEYLVRKEEQISFIKDKNISFMDSDYDNDLFKNISKGLENDKEGGKRCSKCYYLRLEYTALKAKEGNFDYFGTTLSVSPYKNSQKLNKIGEELEKLYGVKHLYSDFKKKDGYKRSIELSNEYNLYRQNYCGCIYSKKK